MRLLAARALRFNEARITYKIPFIIVSTIVGIYSIHFYISGDLYVAYVASFPDCTNRPTTQSFPKNSADVCPKLLCRNVSIKDKLVKIL